MSNTSNTGLPERAPLPPVESDIAETPRERALSGALLVGAAALIVLALVAGFHAVSILYGVLYPPNPPVYDQMRQVSYQNIDHGVDRWRYVSASSPQAIAAYYTDHGATCVARAPDTSYASSEQVGMTCEATTTFSIFTMSYQVVITPEQPTSVVLVSREVYWIGAPPAADSR